VKNFLSGIHMSKISHCVLVSAIWPLLIGPLALAQSSDKMSSRSNPPRVQEVSSSDFDRTVLKSSVPVLVDFHASWCFPCKKLAPILQTLAAKHEKAIHFVSVDVDKEPQLANKYHVQGIPALRLFKNGSVIRSTEGFSSEKSLDEWLTGSAR
jgi:thioredoxin 1